MSVGTVRLRRASLYTRTGLVVLLAFGVKGQSWGRTLEKGLFYVLLLPGVRRIFSDAMSVKSSTKMPDTSFIVCVLANKNIFQAIFCE